MSDVLTVEDLRRAIDAVPREQPHRLTFFGSKEMVERQRLIYGDSIDYCEYQMIGKVGDGRA